MAKSTLLLICGGQSAEHEVTLQSVKNVLSAVNKNKYEIILAGIDKGGKWNRYNPENFLKYPDDPDKICLFNPGDEVTLSSKNSIGYLNHLNSELGRIKIDVAFPVLHGTYGEDGAVQGLLKMANIPYVGCSVTGSAICMDKDVSKKLLITAGIPVARAETFKISDKNKINFNRLSKELGLPLFIKPINLGSSVGISKVNNKKEFFDAVEKAFKYDTKIIIEEFIKGREIECAVLGNENPSASIPGEIIPQHDYYSYEAKYLDKQGAVLKAPAELDEKTIKRVQDLAVKSFTVLQCSGLARVDFFLTDEGDLLVNELNTIPGFTKISMYPLLWELSGIPNSDLIDKLIDFAIDRYKKENIISTDFKE